MAQLTLSKSTYLKEAKKLDNYQRFLPSLDLKRKQLVIEKKRQQKLLLELEQQLEAVMESASRGLPMLANEELEFNNLVSIEAVSVTDENLMGIQLPKLQKLTLARQTYGYLVRPHWVDILITSLSEAVRLSIEVDIHRQRVDRLIYAVRKATQRVNLLEKILIPDTRSNMRKIQIFLSDNERAAVVRSKIAKRKRAEQDAGGDRS